MILLEKGYNKTTVRDIAKACNMSHGSLYHYISSKRDILHLICVLNLTGADEYRRYLSTLRGINKTEQLRKCIAYYFKRLDSSCNLMRVLNHEVGNLSEEDLNLLLESQDDHQFFFEQIIRDGIEAGEFNTSNPFLVAYNILLLGTNWVLRNRFLVRYYTLKEYTEEQTRILLEGLSTGIGQSVDAELSEVN